MDDMHLKNNHPFFNQHKLRPVVIAVTAAIGISGLLTGCGGGGGHNGGGGGGGGAVTQSLVTSGGGSGTTTGTGGSGGSIDLYAAAANTVIEVLTSTSGAPDVKNTNIQQNLGGNGWTVESDITIPIDPADPATVEYFQVTTDCRIHKANGTTDTGDDTIVSGVEVANGVTLTLQNNQGDTGCIDVPNDIVNDGTIKTEIRNTDPALNGGIALTADNYIGVGAITTSGACGTDLNPDAGDIDINTYTAIYNAGNLSAAGADCEKGGNGGNIDLYVSGEVEGTIVNNLWNGGTLDTSGGTSTADVEPGGGYGGDVNLTIDVVTTSTDQNGGRLISGGTIDTSGGDGVAGGGAGGGVYVDLNAPEADGETVLSSNIFILAGIDTSGGAVTGTDGTGGAGGNISMAINAPGVAVGQGGSLELLGFGNITTTGGDGAEGSVALYDGIMSGGNVRLYSDGYDADFTNEVAIDTTGGNALVSGRGGDGGAIGLANFGGTGNIMNKGNLTSNGGNGIDGGGWGGGTYIAMYGDGETSVNSVTNSGKLTSQGGDMSGANLDLYGGDGGYIFIGLANADGTVSNTGAIDNSGGKSSQAYAGHGGGVSIGFYNALNDTLDNSISNNASITSNGGTGALYGGDGGDVYFGYFSDSGAPGVQATNSGSISTQGGVATSTTGDESQGGSGGYVEMYGAPLTNKGNVNASGGNGNLIGGDGGDIKLNSTSGGPTTNTGTLTSAGGLPEGTSTPGTITVDTNPYP